MNVVVPLASTTMVPVVSLDTGSLTVTGVGPAGYTTEDPGSVKLVMEAVVPLGGLAFSSRLRVSGPLPCVMLGASSPSAIAPGDSGGGDGEGDGGGGDGAAACACTTHSQWQGSTIASTCIYS